MRHMIQITRYHGPMSRVSRFRDHSDTSFASHRNGNRSKTLKKAADGSFEHNLQSDSPGADKESNWLPTGKDENFYLAKGCRKTSIL